jgi:hypothetical protein
MKTFATFIFSIFLIFNVLAQEKGYPFRKLSIEPAIGLRVSSAFGMVDLQLSALVQYQVNKRLSLASHTAFSYDIKKFVAFKNVNPKYSFTTYQKFGVGTSVYTKNTAHTFFLLAGGKYFAYSGSVENPKLEDKIQTKFRTFSFDKGLMYNLKVGRSSPYFSTRLYVPVFDGKWVALENAVVEFGAGFHLK